MTRILWLDAQWGVPIWTIAQKMKDNMFTRESHDGFIVNRVRDSFVEAKYIEKYIYQETLIDPFGNEETYDRTIYKQVNSTLFVDFPHIELRNPPRTLNPYISRLLEINNFSLTIDPIHIDILDWVDSIKDKISENIIIDSIQINRLEIDKGISAKVLLKGEKDITETFELFTSGKQYVLEKLQFKIPFNGRVGTVHLSNNASDKIPEFLQDVILPIIRSSLPQPKKAPLIN